MIINEKIWITGVFFLDKGSGSGFFPYPDPDLQHWFLNMNFGNNLTISLRTGDQNASMCSSRYRPMNGLQVGRIFRTRAYIILSLLSNLQLGTSLVSAKHWSRLSSPNRNKDKKDPICLENSIENRFSVETVFFILPDRIVPLTIRVHEKVSEKIGHLLDVF